MVLLTRESRCRQNRELDFINANAILLTKTWKNHSLRRVVFVMIELMDWSTRRKIGCLTLVGIVVIAIVGYFGYKEFFSKPATCFDGIQNQGELGIDCGGPCAALCSFQARSPVVLWSRVFPTASGVNSVVAYVENQNPTAGVAQINYEFRVYDANNILAADPIDGTTFLGPNERTAIFESPLVTGNRVPTTAFFQFTTTPTFVKTDPKFQTPQLTSDNVNLTNVTTTPKLSADIVNDTLYDYSNIPVVAILYDKDGNAINASQTFIASIPEQTTQTVHFTWPQPFPSAVARIEIIPRVNPFQQ